MLQCTQPGNTHGVTGVIDVGIQGLQENAYLSIKNPGRKLLAPRRYIGNFQPQNLPPLHQILDPQMMCVKNSIHGGEYLGRYPLAGTPPLGRYNPGQVHLPGALHAGRYGQEAGGTHPTGMHSCF